MRNAAWTCLLGPMLAVGMGAAGPAEAQGACGARAEIIGALKTRYKEDRQFLGLVGTAGNSMMEVYVSKEGSWTMLVTMASGQTCIMAAGHSFQSLPKLDAGAGA